MQYLHSTMILSVVISNSMITEEDFAKTAKVRCEGAHILALWAGEGWPQLS